MIRRVCMSMIALVALAPCLLAQSVDEIIAKGNKPKAYATYNLREIVAPKTRA